VLRYVRHPWYSSGLPILWTVGPITDANLLTRIILSLYLVIGTLLEERKLLHEIGESYRSYCRQVPMLIPWKGRVKVRLSSE
jgi:protein-S-isoprenylcysteine O-methyltransferase Ste14